MSYLKASGVFIAPLLALAALGTAAGAACAGPVESSLLPMTGRTTATPIGYIAFCARHPDQCGLLITAPAVVVEPDAGALAFAQSLTPPVAAPTEMSAVVLQSYGSAVDASPTLTGLADFGGLGVQVMDATSRFRTDGGEGVSIPSDTTSAAAAISLPVAAPVATPALAALPIRTGSAPSTARDVPPIVALTPTIWRLLETVDRDVNARIRPATDVQAFGQDNYWDLPLENGKNLGNCKHYVLEKRRALAAAGIPEAAMTMAIVRTARDDIHAVLVISTDHGDYLLDNLTPWIEPWNRPNYTWMMRQAPGQPFHWFAMDPRPQITGT